MGDDRITFTEDITLCKRTLCGDIEMVEVGEYLTTLTPIKKQ
jgi:hypothetical protein